MACASHVGTMLHRSISRQSVLLSHKAGPSRGLARGRWTSADFTPRAQVCGLTTYSARRAQPITTASTSEAEADARLLHELFDAQGMAKGRNNSAASLSSRGYQNISAEHKGLFLSPQLQTTKDFEALAQRTLIRCQLIVSRIVAAPQNGRAEMRRVIRNLDRLSDLLCGIIDCAELLRNAHKDAKWVNCANSVYEGLCGYMNELNTHTGLYKVLAMVLDDQELRSSLSQEELAVAFIFLRDFQKSGIHLPDDERARFVRLSDEILVLGRSFLQNGVQDTGEKKVEVPKEWVEGAPMMVWDTLRAKLSGGQQGKMLIRPNSWEMQVIQKYVPDERARKLAYLSTNASTSEQISVLERLLERRAELAELTGSESFASMTLADKMARKPENVDGFLSSLVKHHLPIAQRDLDQLRSLKEEAQGTRDFFAWDRDFYAEKHLQDVAEKNLAPAISDFFSVGTVFAGLSRLFERLYGISLRAAQVQKGEVWDDDVFKIDVIEDGHEIGTIYADLFSRSGKPPSAAHYTVRCSRRTDDDDETGDFFYGRLASGEQIPVQVGQERLSTLDTHPVNLPGKQGRYQLPIVVLLFDIVRTTRPDQPTLLFWQEVETLFHEMGHAIHSMIGRTEFHNVSGTRCATDFVELPSILMEHFLASPDVVGLFARHHRHGSPLDFEDLQKHLEKTRSLDSLDTHNQIMLATLDQLYHGKLQSGNSGSRIDSTATMNSLQMQMGLVPPVEGVAWQAHFSHLFGYGATYYSYLFDRAIAARVWQRLFKSAPLDRQAGEKFKTGVLSHGGGRDPWDMLSQLLQDEDLAEGGDSANAMQAVGRWGISDFGSR